MNTFSRAEMKRFPRRQALHAFMWHAGRKCLSRVLRIEESRLFIPTVNDRQRPLTFQKDVPNS